MSKKALVVGLGASGLAAIEYLVRRGWSVEAADTREAPPNAEKVLAAQGEVHCALAFQAGIALVGAARLGFVDHFVFIGCFVVPFVGVAVAVFPVVAVVEDTLEVNLVIGVDFPVQGQRIALAFAGDVVLAYFVFVEHNLTVFVPFVGHLHVVASCGIVLIRG